MNINIPEISQYEDQAIDAIVTIINQAKSRLNIRQNLFQLASSRNEFLAKAKVSLQKLESPLVKTCEKFISETIKKKWKLTDTFSFVHHYLGSSTDESAHYLYYEAIFSQPTVAYPIPQAAVSVYFRVEDKHLEPADVKGVPEMTFRIEGHYTDHNVRDVLLRADWILAVMKMKINFYERIEAFRLF